MAQYPIQTDDDLTAAVNYLLSGPTGTGQNFSGFSAYAPALIRPTVNTPYMLAYDTTLNANWYLNIPINNIVQIPVLGADSDFITVTFTTPQSTAPFQFGDTITLEGVTPADYNTNYVVYECTTSDVKLRLANGETFDPLWVYVSGGALVRDFANYPVSTDCNANVVVTGGTDRVFISAQVNLDYDFTATTSSDFDVIIQVNRYRGLVSNRNVSTWNLGYNPNQTFVFNFDTTVSQQVFNKTTSSSGSDAVTAEFVQLLDGPNVAPDYYLYKLDIKFVTKPDQYPEFGSGSGSLISERFVQSGTIAPALYGVPTTYTGIAPVSTTGTGSGAVVDVYINTVADYLTYKNNFNSTITVTTPGSGYQVGDILTIPGTSLGGASPDNDLTMEVAQIQYPGDAKPGDFRVRLRSLTAQVVKQ